MGSSCVTRASSMTRCVELDPLTDQREHEHAYLRGEQFPELLAESGVSLG